MYLPQNPQQLLRLGGTWDRAGSLYGVFNDTPNHPLLLRPGPAITAAVWNPSREGEPQYLNRAFSAPRICTVEAGYLARFVRLPAWEMRRAPTYKKKISVRECLVQSPERNKTNFILAWFCLKWHYTCLFFNFTLSKSEPLVCWQTHTTSPMRAARFGATWPILDRRYSCSSCLYFVRETTRLEKLSMLIRSIGEISIPLEEKKINLYTNLIQINGALKLVELKWLKRFS